MADSISIVMTMKTDIDARMKSIASTTQGCSKAFEEFQRRTTELKGKLDALEKKYTSLNQKSASAKTEAEKLKLEMSAMTKVARASGEELDAVSYWQDAAVTNDGVEMLNEWMAGRSIKVVSAYGGTGTVSVDKLTEQTGLVDQRQRLNLVGEENSADGKTVQVQVSNAGLTEEYELNQVGVFALLDPGKESETEPKMLFIMQDEKGVTVPPVTEVSFLLELYCKIGITNNGRFQVSIDSAGVATVGRMREELDQLAASILSGDISAPLETASGEPITTWGGEEIRAHGRIAAGADDGRSYTDMAVSAAMAAMTRMVETKLTGSYIAVR